MKQNKPMLYGSPQLVLEFWFGICYSGSNFPGEQPSMIIDTVITLTHTPLSLSHDTHTDTGIAI